MKFSFLISKMLLTTALLLSKILGGILLIKWSSSPNCYKISKNSVGLNPLQFRFIIFLKSDLQDNTRNFKNLGLAK